MKKRKNPAFGLNIEKDLLGLAANSILMEALRHLEPQKKIMLAAVIPTMLRGLSIADIEMFGRVEGSYEQER